MTTTSAHETMSVVVESAPGQSTLANAKQFRFNEAVTAGEQIGQLQDNPNMGHENVNDKSDRPLHFYERVEDGISFTTMLRVNSGGNDNPATTFFESGGLDVDTQASNTTLAGTPTTTSLELTADVGAIGQASLVTLDNGLLYPVLAADYSASTITPSMALSSAAGAGNAVAAMDTVVAPGNIDVPADKTISFRKNTRMTHTSGEDMAWDYTFCSLNTWSMEFTPGGDVQIPWSFHYCKAAQASDTLAASTFVDAEKYIKLDDNCEFSLATASDSGGIASSVMNFQSMTLTPGTSSVAKDATGGVSYVDTSHYISSLDKTTVTIKVSFAKSYFDDFIAAEQTRRYIHLLQPSTAESIPAFGLWLPNCYLAPDGVKRVAEGQQFVDVELTYQATAANYGTSTVNGSRGMSPFYLAYTAIIA